MPTRQIFKAHNPGCNCCPYEDEGGGGGTHYCGYIAYPVSPFYYVNLFRWVPAQGSWSMNTSAFSANTDKLASLYFPIAGISKSVWLAANLLTVEGVSESYGGSNVNGGVVEGGTGKPLSAGASETCPFGGGFFGSTLYPTFRDTQREDVYNALFGTCFPTWVSGYAAKARSPKVLYLVGSSPAVIAQLEEQPDSSTLLELSDPTAPGPGNIPALFDPEIYWPFKQCVGTPIWEL